jgi:spore germination cell wall hydrolase CwlJ-like protein
VQWQINQENCSSSKNNSYFCAWKFLIIKQMMEATATRKKKTAKQSRSIDCERVFVDVPKSDKMFFIQLANKMGWDVTEHKKKSFDELRIEELKAAILEAKAMGEDIRKNGTKGYKTLDELLAED